MLSLPVVPSKLISILPLSFASPLTASINPWIDVLLSKVIAGRYAIVTDDQGVGSGGTVVENVRGAYRWQVTSDISVSLAFARLEPL